MMAEVEHVELDGLILSIGILVIHYESSSPFILFTILEESAPL